MSRPSSFRPFPPLTGVVPRRTVWRLVNVECLESRRLLSSNTSPAVTADLAVADVGSGQMLWRAPLAASTPPWEAILHAPQSTSISAVPIHAVQGASEDQRLTSPALVDTLDAMFPFRWDLASRDDSSFVFAWLHPTPQGVEVVSQRFQTDGQVAGPRQTWAELPETTAFFDTDVAVTVLDTGSYIIAWTTTDGIFVRHVGLDDVPLGDIVHVGDANTTGYDLDVAAIPDGEFYAVWVNAAGSVVYGHHFGVGAAPSGAPRPLVQATAESMLLAPQLIDHPHHDVALRWTEAPLSTSTPPSGDAPDRFAGGTSSADYEFFFQTFSAQGAPTTNALLLGRSALDVPPGIAIRAHGDMGTVRMTPNGLETEIVLELRDATGTIHETQTLTSSRFLGYTPPQITKLSTGGFVVTYGLPFPDGPLLIAQQFNLDGIPVGPRVQFNAGDDVAFPPRVRVVPQGGLDYTVAWPRQLLSATTAELTTRSARLANTPLKIVVPADHPIHGASPQGVVRIGGLPPSVALTAGTPQTDGTWLLDVAELDGLRMIHDAPPTELVLDLEFRDNTTLEILDAQTVRVTTEGDDVLVPFPDEFLLFGGGGVDTVVLAQPRASIRATTHDDGSVLLQDALLETPLLTLVDIERVRFSDIVLPVEQLLDTITQPLADFFLGHEDTPLGRDADDGVLANDVLPADRPSYALVVARPQHGTLTLGSAGQFTYTPDLHFSGTDSWLYDTRPMGFANGETSSGTDGHFTAQFGSPMPTMAWSDLPNAFIDGHIYSIVFQLVDFVAHDMAFQFAVQGGPALTPQPFNTDHLAPTADGTLSFQFEKTSVHHGFEFIATITGPAPSGSLTFTNFVVTDENTGEIVVNTAVRNHREQTVDIAIQSVPDPPTLLASVASSSSTEPVTLDIAAALVDTDGSEKLSLTLAGVPVGTRITAGHQVHDVADGDSPVDITDWHLPQIQLTPLTEFGADLHLRLTATATEQDGDAHAATEQILSIVFAADATDDTGGSDSQHNATEDNATEDTGTKDPDTSDAEPDDDLPLFVVNNLLNDLLAGTHGSPGNLLGHLWGHTTGTNGGLGFTLAPPVFPGPGLSGLPGLAGGSWTPWSSGQLPGSPAPPPDMPGGDGGSPESAADGPPETPPQGPSGTPAAPEPGAAPQGPEKTAEAGVVPADALAAGSAAGHGTQAPPTVPGIPGLPAVASDAPLWPATRATTMAPRNGAPARALAGPAAAPSSAEPSAETAKSFVVGGNTRVSTIFATQQLWEEMDEIAKDVVETTSTADVVVGSAVIVASGFSAAQVLWLLRGSALVTKFLSSMPVWVAFDPLPILDAQTARAGRSRNPISNESLADIASSV